MRRSLQFLVVLAALVYALGWAVSEARSIKDRSEVAKLTGKMKTVCVGRHLIDVPAQAQVSFSGANIDGFSVNTVEESDTEFRERIAGREREIAARGAATDGSGGMIEAHELRIPGLTGRTFIYGRNRSYWFEAGRRVDDEWVAVEIHAHAKGLSVSLSSKFADEATAASAEGLISGLQVRAHDEVPANAGFCVERAVFIDPLPVHRSEHAVMHIGLPGHPELDLTLASIAGGSPGSSLSVRAAQAEACTSPEVSLRMKRLRERKRLINSIEGEEVLVRAREFNGETSYGFSWDAPGTKDSLLQPYLSLELQTNPVNTSLHEDALLTLWDSIASSIRPQGRDTPGLRRDYSEPGPRQASRILK
jgi:hypothetical protein